MNVFRVKIYADIEAESEDDAIDRFEGAVYGSDIPQYHFLGTEDMGPAEGNGNGNGC